MSQTLFFRTDATILCLLLFLGCLFMVNFGHWVRLKSLKPDEPESKGGVNSLMGALFGLWGFLLAFTFGNSASRFENVRNMMVEETNAMRTAILRTRALPDSIGAEFRADMAKYIQSRVDYYHNVADEEKLNLAKNQTAQIADSLWTKALAVANTPGMTFAANNLFTSITSMLDAATKRDALLLAGVPEPIQYMLFFLALTISFIGGFTTPVIKHKEWIVVGGFILLACCIIYITLDLGRPMRGLIRPESSQKRIEDLQHLLR